MFWIALVIIIFYLVYKAGKRRGNCPDSPTNLTGAAYTFADVIGDGSNAAHELLLRTKIRNEHCRWYRRFEGEVKSLLDLAQDQLDIDRELQKSPELKKLYFESLELRRTERQEKQVSVKNWFNSGPPIEPISTGVAGDDVVVLDEYMKNRNEHEAFVSSTNKRLRADLDLYRIFKGEAETFGSRELLSKYFVQ